jgi:hypothetical protein
LTNNYVDSFLYATALAYLAALLLPRRALRNVPMWAERLGFLLCGLLLLANLTFGMGVLWAAMCALWILFAEMSYLGYAQWNVLWRKDASDAAQMFMSAWDLAVAICCMVRFLTRN